MNKVRIGIVGAGANTRDRHIPGLKKIDGVEIVSVCNRTRESSERVAKEFDIPKVYGDWRELVDAGDTDAIVIGTWPYLHARVSIAALEAGKHVMCEARMAMNAAEAHEMLDAAQQVPELVTQVVPSPFTLGVDGAIRRLIADGFLGELLAIEVRDGGRFLDKDAPMTWRDDADLSGFNTLTLGIWYEALLRWVGPATGVSALGKVYTKMRAAGEQVKKAVQIPEHLDVIAGMACGAQLHMQFSKVTGMSGPAEVLLFGSEGTLSFRDGTLRGGKRGGDGLREIKISPAESGCWRVEEEFINAIRGKEKITLTTFEDGVKYMEFTEAVWRSMQEGKAIGLPL